VKERKKEKKEKRGESGRGCVDALKGSDVPRPTAATLAGYIFIFFLVFSFFRDYINVYGTQALCAG
jgi:hypothetical protein